VDLSVIIVNWNTAELTLRSLEALQTALPSRIDAEVVVVDNGSTDGSADRIADRCPDVRLIRRSDNGGFARANNEAFVAARGDLLFLLNSDALALPGSVEALTGYLDQHPRCGLVAARLLNADLSLQPSCWRFPRWDTALLEALYLYRLLPSQAAGERLLSGYWDHSRVRPVDWVMGAAMMVRRAAIDHVGGFDERHFMYGEDLDWCWRIRRAGWEIAYEPAASVIHLGGQSSAQQFGGVEEWVKHEAYYRFCQEWLGPGHTGCLRAINFAGALLRLGVYSFRRVCRPTAHTRQALGTYCQALKAHSGWARE
jgi:GT2 family glycosyltransferase